MFYILLVFCVSLGLFSCSSKSPAFDPVCKVVQSSSKEMEEKGLHLAYYKGNSNKHIIALVARYASHKSLNLEESRRLMVNVVEDLLYKSNREGLSGSCFCEMPFTYKNVEASLAFYKDGNEYVGDDSVAYVSLVKEKLLYFVFDRKKGQLELLHKEPYAEGLQIIQRTEKIKEN